MRIKLLAWFEASKRNFPWREHISPYRVWVSEVMLQQTRASVVVPYFLRWMEQFPDPATLAAAPLETVIKAWEGLGYYSRARNLHRGAKIVVEQFGGFLPASRETLLQIPGIGAYTASAILSFGFHKKALAIDGNVARTASRLFAVQENLAKRSAMQAIAEKAEALLDEEKPWLSAEAFIELGATICLPRPCCAECPLQADCQGKRLGIAENLPIKNESPAILVLHRTVAVVVCEGKVWVRKESKKKLMQDLYEFPCFETDSFSLAILEQEMQCQVRRVRSLKQQTALFTRYRAQLRPSVFVSERCSSAVFGTWIDVGELPSLPFSSGHRRIAQELLTEGQDDINK